jgi:hypothetical protein
MQSTVFLPVPRLPASAEMRRVPDPDELDALTPGGGAFARKAAEVYREAFEAVMDLESHRPGGQGWAAALEADAKAAASGKPPKAWAVEILLAEDGRRWAQASALARTVVARVAAARAEADGPGIAKAAQARITEASPKLAERAEAAYRLARAGDERRSPAWKAFEEARELRDELTRLRGIAAWAEGRESTFDPTGWGPGWDGRTAGYFISAERLLTNAGPMLSLPQGVVWPSDHDLPDLVLGAKGVSLREGGYAEDGVSDRPQGGRVIP